MKPRTLKAELTTEQIEIGYKEVLNNCCSRQKITDGPFLKKKPTTRGIFHLLAYKRHNLFLIYTTYWILFARSVHLEFIFRQSDVGPM